MSFERTKYLLRYFIFPGNRENRYFGDKKALSIPKKKQMSVEDIVSLASGFDSSKRYSLVAASVSAWPLCPMCDCLPMSPASPSLPQSPSRSNDRPNFEAMNRVFCPSRPSRWRRSALRFQRDVSALRQLFQFRFVAIFDWWRVAKEPDDGAFHLFHNVELAPQPQTC